MLQLDLVHERSTEVEEGERFSLHLLDIEQVHHHLLFLARIDLEELNHELHIRRRIDVRVAVGEDVRPSEERRRVRGDVLVVSNAPNEPAGRRWFRRYLHM